MKVVVWGIYLKVLTLLHDALAYVRVHLSITGIAAISGFGFYVGGGEGAV